MSAYVILAAGRGSRMGRIGEGLHKALAPVDDRAVITHQLDNAPAGARVIVCVGHRADQLRDFIALAHPQLRVTFVDVAGWDQPGAGPGTSLLAARPFVGADDMVVTTCDTLWRRDDTLWSGSWVGVAAMPAGTHPNRWCRIDIHDGHIAAIVDKDDQPTTTPLPVFVGLARITASDLPAFWQRLAAAEVIACERQLSGGFTAGMPVRRIHWTDTGDETSYRQVAAHRYGYDNLKSDQATYLSPTRVVKFSADGHAKFVERAAILGDAVPQPIRQRGSFVSYPYIYGVTGYRAADHEGPTFTQRLLRWHAVHHLPVTPVDPYTAAERFYFDKTTKRIAMLPLDLQQQATAALERINWNDLVEGVEPGWFHGDFTYANVIVNHRITGIDWRPDFAGELWGDLRYDHAKLLAATYVHWDRARRGDITPWRHGPDHAAVIRDYVGHRADVDTIAGLTLLNSAPLHAAPIDAMLVRRGVELLT